MTAPDGVPGERAASQSATGTEWPAPAAPPQSAPPAASGAGTSSAAPPGHVRSTATSAGVDAAAWETAREPLADDAPPAPHPDEPPARRWLLPPLLAGGLGSLAAATLLPLATGDPFRGTLVLLPFLLGAFRSVRIRVEARGGRRLPRGSGLGEIAALALLVAAILGRAHLGVGGLEPVLAAGLALVLAHRLARQLLAARPLLGREVPRRPPAVFFVLPLLAYLALLPWSAGQRQPDGDEPFYLLITHSLVHDRDAELTNNYAAGDWRHFMRRPIEPQPGDPVGPRGERYSRHNELLPLVLAPAYAAAGKAGALATMAALAAALAWTALRLARHYLPRRPGEALAAYALVAFTPPLLLYAGQVWVEVPAALLAALALDRIRELHGRPWRWRDWLGIGLPVLLLPLLKMRFVLLAAPLLLLGWWRAGRPRGPVIALAAALGAVSGGMLLYNQLLYSNPLKIHSWSELELTQYSPRDYLLGGLGLFFDSAFGLFAAAPLWLLLLPAAVRLARRLHPLVVDLAVLVAPYLLVVVPRPEWYGGWSPPFRYALVALPLLGLAVGQVLGERRRAGARLLVAGLGALTLVLALVWIAVPGWTYNFADGRSYLLDDLAARLGADVARLFPSAVRPRPATWIWPLAALLAVPALGRWRGGRRARRAGAWLGVPALLLAAAALPPLAAGLPTHTIEFEDSQVEKSGGHVYPDLWVIERTRHRGGWVLRVEERLTAPVAAGGRRVRLALAAQFIRNQPVPFSVDVRAGDRHLATWRPARPRVWERVTLGPFDWPAGAPLVVEAFGPHPPGALNGVLLDKAELEWLE